MEGTTVSGKSFRRRFLTESKAIAAPVWMQMRQQGKSAALAAMYGTGRMQRTHPFDFVSGYTYVSHDTRFGSVPVYKVTTKTTSEIMRRERVPHTDVYYRPADELMLSLIHISEPTRL